MDLRQLDYFVHVAELGSFSKAASLLSIAESALSTRVRKLEVELKPAVAASQWARRHTDRRWQAPAPARTRHPDAGGPHARGARRVPQHPERPHCHRPAAHHRQALDGA